MKKKSMFFLLGILVGSCSHSQTKTFKNEFYNYEFSYHQEWAIEVNQGTTDVIAPKSNPQEKGHGRLTISSEKISGRSLEECYKIYVEDWYKEQFDGHIKAEGSTVLRGRNAKWMEYQFEQGEASITSLIYLVYCGDRF